RGVAELRDEPRREVRARGQRIGDREVAELLLHQHPVEIAAADAAEFLRHRDRGQALIGDLRAQLRAAAAVGLPDLAQQFRRGLDHEELVYRVAECELLLFEDEVHDYVASSCPRRRASSFAFTLWASPAFFPR